MNAYNHRALVVRPTERARIAQFVDVQEWALTDSLQEVRLYGLQIDQAAQDIEKID